MNSWAPLWNGLVDSSIWEEPDHVFRVFIAMMSLKDGDHIVRYDGYRLSKRIHVPLDQVLDALRILAAPDTRRPGQEYDGRRLEAVEDGWLVLNGEKYREMIQVEMRKSRNRKAQAAYRERRREMNEKQQLAYEKGREAARKKPMTLKECEIEGRSDQVSESIDEAHEEIRQEREQSI